MDEPREAARGTGEPLPRDSHDFLIRLGTLDPEALAAIIRMGLQPEFAALLKPDGNPKECRTTLVDGKGRTVHVDGLWSVDLKGGGQAFVLLEHKSTRDHGTGVQMLGYISRVMSAQLETGTKPKDLAPVWPVLIYGGRAEWNGPLLVGGAEPGRRYPDPLSLTIPVTDLARMELDQLPENVRARAYLRALALAASQKWASARDVATFGKAIAMGGMFGQYLGDYMAGKVRIPEELREGTEEMIRGTLAAKWWDEGKAEGKAEERVRLFMEEVRKQFGELSDHLVKVIMTAPREKVEAWSDRLRGAPSTDFVMWTEKARRDVADMALQIACAATERTGDGSAHGGNLRTDSIRSLLSDAVKADGIDGAAVQRKAYMIAATRAEAELRAAAADRIFEAGYAEEQARFGEEPDGTNLEQRLEWRQAVDAGLAGIRRKGVEPTAAELVVARAAVFAEGTDHEPLAEALAEALERGPLEWSVEVIHEQRAELADGLMTEWTPAEDAGHHSTCMQLFRSFTAPEIWAMANGRTDGIREFPANADSAVVGKNVKTLLLSAGTGPAAWHGTARAMAQELGIRMDHSREHGIEIT